MREKCHKLKNNKNKIKAGKPQRCRSACNQYMPNVVRKPVLRGWRPSLMNLACSAIGTRWSIEIPHVENSATVKPVLSGHSNIDKTKVLKTDGTLMQVESIAECCNTFDLH